MLREKNEPDLRDVRPMVRCPERGLVILREKNVPDVEGTRLP